MGSMTFCQGCIWASNGINNSYTILYPVTHTWGDSTRRGVTMTMQSWQCNIQLHPVLPDRHLVVLLLKCLPFMVESPYFWCVDPSFVCEVTNVSYVSIVPLLLKAYLLVACFHILKTSMLKSTLSLPQERKIQSQILTLKSQVYPMCSSFTRWCRPPQL